jgi:RimJ/RimL family protein N-acetyltransferase
MMPPRPDAAAAFALVQCDAAGEPLRPVGPLPAALRDNCAASAALYAAIGYEPPWVSYVALCDGEPVGGGAFVGAPRDGAVEIAYFTLAAFERRGLAGRTAAALVHIARAAAPDVTITAKTLRGSSASTKILERLGFRHVREVVDDEAGLVWEWRLPGAT